MPEGLALWLAGLAAQEAEAVQAQQAQLEGILPAVEMEELEGRIPYPVHLYIMQAAEAQARSMEIMSVLEAQAEAEVA